MTAPSDHSDRMMHALPLATAWQRYSVQPTCQQSVCIQKDTRLLSKQLHSKYSVLKLNCRCCSATADAPPVAPDEQHRQSEARVRRLKVLVQLRRLYRNLIRGQCLLDYPSPVYSQTGGPP